MASAFSSSREAMLVLTEQWRIIEANQTFVQLSRCDPRHLTAQPLQRFLDLPAAMSEAQPPLLDMETWLCASDA